MIIAHPASPASVFSVRHHAHSVKVLPVQKKPPVIVYIGGRHPHVTVSLIWGNYPVVSVSRRRTPRGWVTVRWREDSGTESGEPAPLSPEADISHPDTIINIVVASPLSLPVYFRGAGDAKWAHLNGSRVPASRPGDYLNGYPNDPFRMNGGLNSIAIGYPDAE